MAKRANLSPAVVRPGQPVVRLERVGFQRREFDEAWLRDLLFENARLLPVDEIEPVFAPLVPIATELATPVGPVDLFCVSPEGYPTLVEVKLWRNPEARRQVVAQAIDYAAQVSRWSYSDLVEAVRARRPDIAAADPLIDLLNRSEGEVDEQRFTDALARNLRLGRMLLLIVGDGIHESVEQMAETLGQSPHLGFTLGLVESSIYRLPGASSEYVVFPRLVMRTQEVVRAVVEVNCRIAPEDVRVKLPTAAESRRPGARVSLTQEAYLARLAETATPALAEKVRTFLSEVRDLGVELVGRHSSLSLHYQHPASERWFNFGSLVVDGEVDFYSVLNWVVREGLPEAVAMAYLRRVAELVPGSRIETKVTKTGDHRSFVKVEGRHVSLAELLRTPSDWLEAIRSMMAEIDHALNPGD